MRYLHTMLRVRNLDAALKFYHDALGLKEVRRVDNDKGRFTLVFPVRARGRGLFKSAPKNRGAPLVELTYNWDEEKYGEDRYFGHLAYEVDDIYATCDRLMKMGVTINRPPRDGNMAFIRSPDLHSIELLQRATQSRRPEPWSSMPNTATGEAPQFLAARPPSRLSPVGEGGRVLTSPADANGSRRVAAKPPTSTSKCERPSTETATRLSRSRFRCPRFPNNGGTSLFAVRCLPERGSRRRRWDEEFCCGCWVCLSR